MNRFGFKDKHSLNYFEGWYTRVTDTSKKMNYAFIFALTYNEEDPHAFIQIFDGTKGDNAYHRFHIEEFFFSDNTVNIGKNILSERLLKVDIKGFQALFRLDNRLNSGRKSAMGFLRFLPLECYQEVVFMEARAKGTLRKNGVTKKLEGQSYMEKTYGRRFPMRWFWLQANHFSDDKLTLSMAGGNMPVFRFSPFGFFVLLVYDNKAYRFSSYNLASLRKKRTGSHVHIVVQKGFLTLDIDVELGPSTRLEGPGEKARMDLAVYESLNSILQLTLKRRGKVIVRASSAHVGSEWMA